MYQKDKRLFGFVKDWVSFIYDKAIIDGHMSPLQMDQKPSRVVCRCSSF